MGVPRCFHKFTKPYSLWVPFGTLKIKKWVRFTEVHKNYREISTITTVTEYDSITNDDRPRQRVSGNSGIERSHDIEKGVPWSNQTRRDDKRRFSGNEPFRKTPPRSEPQKNRVAVGDAPGKESAPDLSGRIGKPETGELLFLTEAVIMGRLPVSEDVIAHEVQSLFMCGTAPPCASQTQQE